MTEVPNILLLIFTFRNSFPFFIFNIALYSSASWVPGTVHLITLTYKESSNKLPLELMRFWKGFDMGMSMMLLRVNNKKKLTREWKQFWIVALGIIFTLKWMMHCSLLLCLYLLFFLFVLSAYLAPFLCHSIAFSFSLYFRWPILHGLSSRLSCWAALMREPI